MLACGLALALSACPGTSGVTPRDGAKDSPIGDTIPKDGQPIPVNCGDKVKDTGEECDDGNKDNNDACLNTCKLAYCGDGFMQKGVEECDDANQDNNDACSINCRSQGFQVNSITTGDQRHPSVAAQSDGTLLVVWTDASATGSDTSGTTVRLRRFDIHGKALDAAEVVLPTTTSNDQRDPDVAVNAQDQALVVWTDWSNPGNTEVRARLVTKAGAPSGSDFLVNSTTTGPQAAPAVCATPDGGYAVVYNDTSIGGSSHGTDVRMRTVSAAGQPTGSDKQVNTSNQGDQMWPDVAAAPGGNLLLVWQSWSSADKESSANGIGIAGRIFSASGSAVTLEEIYNAVGKGDQENPQVAFDAASGQFVVVWEDDSKQGADSDGFSIRMRQVSTAGQAGAQEEVANTTTTKSQQHAAVGAGGGVVAVAWDDASQAGQGLDIRARRYKGGTPVDATDRVVNTSTSLDQVLPAVAVTSAGYAAVVWESTGCPGDNAGYGIRMRILGP